MFQDTDRRSVVKAGTLWRLNIVFPSSALKDHRQGEIINKHGEYSFFDQGFVTYGYVKPLKGVYFFLSRGVGT